MELACPETLGFDSGRLARIVPALQRYINSGKIAGMVSLVARHGKIAHFESFGCQDIVAEKEMRLDSIFRIYSMTKPITSAAAMMLFEENRFRLNDPISLYLPEFKKMKVIDSQPGKPVTLVDASREITVRDLFTHSSGMSYGFDEQDYLDGLYRSKLWRMLDKSTDIDLAGVVRAVARLPLRFHPGTRWHYSFSIDVLGYLVEVISGVSFDRFLKERIFGPLGMVDTAFWVPPEKVGRLACNYGPGEKSGSLKDIDPLNKSSYTRPVSFTSGGGGLVSTAADYLRFCQMLLNKGELDGVRLLGRKTVEFMFLNHLPPGVYVDQDPSRGFGLGGAVVLDPAPFQMMGSKELWWWGGAANTIFWIDPKEDLVGLLMLQFMPSGKYPIEADFRNLVYQALNN